MARRPKFEDPAQLREKIDEYFAGCGAEIVGEGREARLIEKPPTVSGLALALGVTRKVLLEWIEDDREESSRNPECVQLLVEAKARIEAFMESRIITDYTKGLEFIMTNTFRGWANRQAVQMEADVKHGGTVRHEADVALKMSDEELLDRLQTLRARADEIARRESAEE